MPQQTRRVGSSVHPNKPLRAFHVNHAHWHPSPCRRGAARTAAGSLRDHSSSSSGCNGDTGYRPMQTAEPETAKFIVNLFSESTKLTTCQSPAIAYSPYCGVPQPGYKPPISGTAIAGGKLNPCAPPGPTWPAPTNLKPKQSLPSFTDRDGELGKCQLSIH